MITYNWLKVYKLAKGHPRKIMDIMDYIVNRPIPKDDYDVETKKMAVIDWEGDSYLINPEPVLENRPIFTDKELAEYVGLASFRNLAEYKTTKRKTLPVSDSPVEIESYKDNKLLSVVDNQVYFKWEETIH